MTSFHLRSRRSSLEIHRGYLDAGADLITTNTFNSNRISMADYGMEDQVYDMNFNSAKLAEKAITSFENSEKPESHFIVGTLGPTNRTASMSSDVNDPGARLVSFDQLAEAYTEQAAGLIDGGVHILMVETIFDVLNCKAALFAIETIFEERGIRLPVMVSGTITDASGRTLTGQTLEAFLVSVSHFPLFSIGLNCALGAEQLQTLYPGIVGYLLILMFRFIPMPACPTSLVNMISRPHSWLPLLRSS